MHSGNIHTHCDHQWSSSFTSLNQVRDIAEKDIRKMISQVIFLCITFRVSLNVNLQTNFINGLSFYLFFYFLLEAVIMENIIEFFDVKKLNTSFWELPFNFLKGFLVVYFFFSIHNSVCFMFEDFQHVDADSKNVLLLWLWGRGRERNIQTGKRQSKPKEEKEKEKCILNISEDF